ncbi:MAG: DUF4136 domain-containing protein [Enhygromyxa sp.]
MSPTRLPIASLLGACLLLAACGDEGEASEDESGAYEPTVEVEVNQNADLSRYTTYDIVNLTPSPQGIPPRALLDVQAQIDDAIVAELGSRGLTRDRSSPQLLVNPLVNREPTTSTGEFYQSMFGWYWGYDYVWTVEFEYAEGSLVLDVVDRGDVDDVGDDLLIYRGAVHALIAQDSEVIRRELRSSVQAMFAGWPGQEPAT